MGRTFVAFILLGWVAAAATAQAQELTVVSLDPARHSVVPVNTTLSVTFDRAVQTSSVTSSSFRVFGRQSGTASGTFSFSNSDQTVMFTPSQPFHVGEVILVNLSNALVAADASPMRSAGYAYQVLTEAQSASLGFTEIDVLSNRTDPDVRVRIYGVMTGDLNNDDYIDLTTVNEESGDLRVFLNTADGSGLYDPYLTPPLSIGFESSPNEPADFNNDGNMDIAVSSTAENSVWIALGNGDGTFDPAQEVAVGLASHGIAVLDVDGDADLDIVNANAGSSNLSLTINNGSGVFGVASFFEGGGSAEYALGTADMNNDGIYDLIVGAQSSQTVIVNLGNGNGTFTAQTPQSAGGAVWMLVPGDVNGDLDMDVTTANSGSNNGAILLGNGDGTLQTPDTVSAPGSTIATDVGDLDGDGDLDWVLSSFQDGANGIWRLFTNDGSGNFSLNQTFDADNASSCASLVDFDNDGDLDLALTDELDDKVYLKQNGNGPPPPTPTPTAPPSPACPATPQTCRTPVESGKALLKMKDDMSPKDKDQLLWKWLKGAATTKVEYGDPLNTDSYTLCIYDNGTLAGSATAEQGGNCDGDPCWTDDGTGFTFKDKLLDPYGVQRLKMQEGIEGKARILLKGKGPNLDLPSPNDITGPVDVQLIKSSGGVCWGAHFSTFIKKDTTLLKAKAD